MSITFLHVSYKHHVDLKLDCFFQTAMNRRYIVGTKIFCTFHARVKYIYVKNMLFKLMGQKP